MAKFLTTLESSARIERIVREAKKKIVLICPYLNMNARFFERLKDADDRGIPITFIYGKQDLRDDQRQKLGELKNICIYYCEHLHAKCYFNEETMVITSLNLLEFSQNNNREMGILIKRRKDTDLYNNALRESESILNSSDEEKQNKNRVYSENTCSNNFWEGPEVSFCIRCGRPRAYPGDPYCKKCYFEWKDKGKPDITEKVCVACGEEYEATFYKPLCEKCYKKGMYHYF